MAFVVLAVFVSVLAFIDTAVAEPVRLRVLTEDAYATQCRASICATVQVTRSTYSTGEVETILFFSAYDAAGNPLDSPFEFPFTLIPTEAFKMNRRGTKAVLEYGAASVVWEDTGQFSSITDSSTRVRDTRGLEFGQGSYRLTERSQVLGADATGIVGSTTFDTEAANLTSGDFGSGFLTIRKTLRVTKGE